jgi:hypothetical protein
MSHSNNEDHEAWQRRVMLGVIVLVLICSAGYFVAYRHRGASGDPDGQILAKLELVSRALPRTSNVTSEQDEEPQKDSCDGLAGTQGWTDAVVQIDFKWSKTTKQLFSYANRNFHSLGWRDMSPSHQPNEPSMGWVKGTSAADEVRAQINEQTNGSWTLLAQAPPDGRRPGGC